MAGETPPDGRPGTNGARTLVVAAMESAAIGDARRRLVQQVASWGGTDLDAIALVCSELITNAVVHAGGAVQIRLTDLGREVRVEVDDRGAGQPHLRTASQGPGGFGLHIVGELSEQWGSEHTPEGNRVWAIVSSVSVDRDHATPAQTKEPHPPNA